MRAAAGRCDSAWRVVRDVADDEHRSVAPPTPIVLRIAKSSRIVGRGARDVTART
jgi:hypothetical protein